MCVKSALQKILLRSEGDTLVTLTKLAEQRAEYIRVGKTVTVSPRPFLIFFTTLCLNVQQPHTLNKVQHVADEDIRKVTWFREMMTQVPKS
jgi:hypothetical protein